MGVDVNNPNQKDAFGECEIKIQQDSVGKVIGRNGESINKLRF